MKPLSSNSYSWVCSSFSSVGAIRYGAFDTGAVPGSNSISNEIARSGGKPGNSLGKTSTRFRTIGISSGLALSSLVVSAILAKYPVHPLEIIFRAFMAKMTVFCLRCPSPTKLNFSSSLGLNVTLQIRHSIVALYFARKSIPRIMS